MKSKINWIKKHILNKLSEWRTEEMDKGNNIHNYIRKAIYEKKNTEKSEEKNVKSKNNKKKKRKNQ